MSVIGTHVATAQEPHGGELVIRQDPAAPGGLLLSAAADGIAVTVSLSRDQVQNITQALDGWLYESRPR